MCKQHTKQYMNVKYFLFGTTYYFSTKTQCEGIVSIIPDEHTWRSVSSESDRFQRGGSVNTNRENLSVDLTAPADDM